MNWNAEKTTMGWIIAIVIVWLFWVVVYRAASAPAAVATSATQPVVISVTNSAAIAHAKAIGLDVSSLCLQEAKFSALIVQGRDLGQPVSSAGTDGQNALIGPDNRDDTRAMLLSITGNPQLDAAHAYSVSLAACYQYWTGKSGPQ